MKDLVGFMIFGILNLAISTRRFSSCLVMDVISSSQHLIPQSFGRFGMVFPMRSSQI